ncbi:SLAP domain-containing protein [Companilactobacillus allii]|uniref:S-layer protein C-terminal domain-containing protein n=1 Tax=Companilactobacillus allii TaxID=1847728 RepID=A0A1P8Q0D2_9LACO|nr:SLAP domain-containing protein [Companilactobacillus allii]APX71330.1 hypothetical protein BTM29_01630 [Companilactobacillus allii]USQ68410.1 SLAP domain-containing protein [Companilactobacillus allii]
MKKTKSLVITSLLFSTMILNPSVINGVMVQAAANEAQVGQVEPGKPNPVTPPTTATKDVTVIYLDAATKKPIDNIKNGTVTVDKDATSVDEKLVKATDGFKLSEKQDYTINDKGEINVLVTPDSAVKPDDKKTKTITVTFVDTDDSKVTFNSSVEVPKDATNIDSSKLKDITPSGYEISLKELIDIKDNHITVSVKNLFKTVTIRFQDSTDNTKKFESTTMKVDRKAKKVKGSTIKAPKGYVVTGRELITIKNGQMLVHIKPADYNAGHVASKSDIYVHYINDKNTSAKFKEAIIKDVASDITSIDNSLVTAPKGYKIVEGQKFNISYGMIKVHVVPSTTKPTAPTKPTKPGHSNGSGATTTHAKHKTTVHFIDKETGKTIHSTSITGTEGQKHEIDLPENYELATGETNKTSTGKADKTIEIKVVKKAVSGTITNHKTVISSLHVATLYSKDGKAIKNRAISANSNWAADKKLVLNGVTYYRVATNEWVKASDAYEYVAVNKSITTSGHTAKTLYNSNGTVIKSRALSAGSAWHTDKTATINGKTMYRVATNEWVLASDLV